MTVGKTSHVYMLSTVKHIMVQVRLTMANDVSIQPISTKIKYLVPYLLELI